MATTKRRTGTRRRSTALARTKPLKTDLFPAERILFTHPSHLSWWWLKNAEANPELAKLITGVFCVFVETKSGSAGVAHYKEMKERCEAIGWKFIPGLRFSHRSRGDWGRMTDIKEHQAIIKQAANWPSLMLDCESYGIKSGTRYHSGGEAYALHEAAEPWAKFKKPLFVYPPMFQAPGSILQRNHVVLPVRDGVALDHSTYEASRFGKGLKKAMELRFNYYAGRARYCPGFYLKYLKDRKAMSAAAKYGRCWFFGSPKGDDRRRFMTPEWAPDKTG